jgi:hypothetical protein
MEGHGVIDVRKVGDYVHVRMDPRGAPQSIIEMSKAFGGTGPMIITRVCDVCNQPKAQMVEMECDKCHQHFDVCTKIGDNPCFVKIDMSDTQCPRGYGCNK